MLRAWQNISAALRILLHKLGLMTWFNSAHVERKSLLYTLVSCTLNQLETIACTAQWMYFNLYELWYFLAVISMRDEGKNGQIYFLSPSFFLYFIPLSFSPFSLLLPFLFFFLLLFLPLIFYLVTAFGLQMFCRFCTTVQQSGLSVAHFQ